MATDKHPQNSLHKSEPIGFKTNNEAIYAQATFAPPTSITSYTPTPLTTFTPFISQDTSTFSSPILPPTTLDKDFIDFVDHSLATDLPSFSTLQPIPPDITIKPNPYLELPDITSPNTTITTSPANTNNAPTNTITNTIPNTITNTITNTIKNTITNTIPNTITNTITNTTPKKTANVTDSSNSTNSTPTNSDTNTPNGKKKGKRGRKPAQDPPYTKLYKKPWLDGWATCRRLALEYTGETKVIAQRANLPLSEVRRLPSHADLSGGNSMRVWTPMELILARAFLKEANLVNTSTKKGAVIRGDISIEQLPDLISKSVLPSTHAVHYNPKERTKDPNAPAKPKKPKKQKFSTCLFQKIQSPFGNVNKIPKEGSFFGTTNIYYIVPLCIKL
eukprot:Phypoly_transcript_10613.p1 GENE.Phypoly_transcript_10613~~Phypoly_transcript_10613.p1  ORF type:complete len:390 (+),score=79.95 Phypoly_transcript_10613:108-1277(+)